MSKKTIDIAISFNDIIPPKEVGFVNKSISYYDQLVALIVSIKLNWDPSVYDYNIYVHYSKDLNPDKKDYLELLGCNLIFSDAKVPYISNRSNVFNFNTNGDYTLILDTDTLIIKTPEFEFDKEIYVKPTPANPIYSWEPLYNRCNIPYNPNEPHHFNNGCILVKNEVKSKIYDLLLSELYQNLLSDLKKNLIPGTRVSHYAGQIAISLIYKNFNLGYFNSSINVFSNKPYNLNYVSILHYLGVNGYTNHVRQIIQNNFKKWHTEYTK